jgi:acetyl esterase/lipase
MLLLVVLPACHVTDMPLWRAARPSSADLFEVEQVRGVTYFEGLPADTFRHQLDLFLPRGLKDYPVVLLVHGGAWIMGDNRSCGLYSAVGECLARQGIGAVLPNYRLSPEVRHPEHIKDVARAFSWTRAHIGEYGGNAADLFVAGHSAGGHLVSLLATDKRYLQAEGLCLADIRGVIGVSGVYHIPPLTHCVTIGGPTAVFMRLDEVLPFRRSSACSALALVPGFPVRLNVFRMAFGNDLAEREEASPLVHVRPGLPPFLIVSGEKDLPNLPDMAEEFHQALLAQGVESTLLKVADRNHNSALFRAYRPDDPVARAMCDFVRRHSVSAAP